MYFPENIQSLTVFEGYTTIAAISSKTRITVALIFASNVFNVALIFKVFACLLTQWIAATIRFIFFKTLRY